MVDGIVTLETVVAILNISEPITVNPTVRTIEVSKEQ